MPRRLILHVFAAAIGLMGGVAGVRAADAPGKPGPAAAAAPARDAANAISIGNLQSAVDDLKLTGDAKARVDAILAKAKEDAAGLQGNGNRRQAMAQIVRSAAEEISAALDEDQRLLFQGKLQAAARAAGAQGRGGPAGAAGGAGGPRFAAVADRIKEAVGSLGLSNEQRPKVDAVVADLEKKLEELRAAGPGPETRQKVVALRADALKQLRSILTDEQRAKFQEAIRQPPQGAGGAAAAGPRIQAVLQNVQAKLAELNLTDDQKVKVRSAFEETRRKFQELRPQLQGGPPSPELREKIRTTLEDFRKQLDDILTPEQREKIRDAIPGGPQGRPGGAGRPTGKKPAQK
ncbi:MAG TPA: hypothetical protein VH475_17010 [Tepidisphaeraceae bacterium]